LSIGFGKFLFGILHKVFAVKNCKIVEIAQKPVVALVDDRLKHFNALPQTKRGDTPSFYPKALAASS
jgi:hypothetical protein